MQFADDASSRSITDGRRMAIHSNVSARCCISDCEPLNMSKLALDLNGRILGVTVVARNGMIEQSRSRFMTVL